MMETITRAKSPAVIWLILMMATLLSYVFAIDGGRMGSRLAGSAVIIIALAKAWLIGMHYMELSKSARVLRLIFYGWVVVVGAMLLPMFWLAN